MTTRWWSQQFPPEGSVASAGILRQLGTPTLDPLVVLLRETAQNSWDARLDDAGTVSLGYGVYELGEQARVLREVLLPGPEGDLDDLADNLTESSSLIRVSDRNTTGLGGPLRSNEAPGDDPPNFVNLVRNVGEARDREFGGGTYGFGKGALFRVSRPGVVIVDTLCRHGGGVQRRVIAAALGSAFVRGNTRYTGRHWWGEVADDGIVDPLLGDDAVRVAEVLGLRGFDSGEPGTDVYILGADLGETDDGRPRNRQEAAEVLVSASLWYLWPKLLSGRADGHIELTVRVDGDQVAVPQPSEVPELTCFVEALRSIDAGGGEECTRKSDPKSVGFFSSSKYFWPGSSGGPVTAAAPFDGPAHHCARMRHLELIVDYLPGPEPAKQGTQYGAVFRASADELSEASFAAAEPPTHDAWNTQHLSGTQRGVVSGARSFVRKRLEDLANPEGHRTGAGSSMPLGVVSNALAAMLPAGGGDGAGSQSGGGGSGGGGGGGGRNSRVRAKAQPRLVVRRGEAVIEMDVTFDQVNRPLAARAHGDVAVDGRRERNGPSGAPKPKVLGWRSKSGTWRDGDDLVVDPTDEREWVVVVRPAPDTSTILRVVEIVP